jgi:hypothetical protein
LNALLVFTLFVALELPTQTPDAVTKAIGIAALARIFTVLKCVFVGMSFLALLITSGAGAWNQKNVELSLTAKPFAV